MKAEKESKVKEQNLVEEIEIPEGVNAELIDAELILKKGDEELKRKINPRVDVKIEGNKLTLKLVRNRKTEKKVFGTMKAHIRNMIKGFDEKFKYVLKIANVHFPMSVSHDKTANELIVKNFLGEKKDRRIKLIQGVDVKIDNDSIELQGIDIEKAGQCAANIEKGTKVRNKDRRIFQDGIFIIEKPGRSFM